MAYDADPNNRLTAVRASIDACLSSQAYSIAGRNKQMAQLAQLRQLERELIEEALLANAGPSCATLGIQVRPSR